jgi:hypothetical protein
MLLLQLQRTKEDCSSSCCESLSLHQIKEGAFYLPSLKSFFLHPKMELEISGR